MRGFLAVVMLCGCAVSATAETASWYNEDQQTASGERYDRRALTAAHRALPFGAHVKVCRNGRCVVVRINDRGPAAWTRRDIDLSEAAAREIGLIDIGVGKVLMEIVK